MPDQPYKKNDHSFNKEANDLLHTQIFTLLGEIKVQTTEHNHRMTKMEKWRERINTAVLVSGLFLSVVIMPIVGWGLWLLVQVQGQMDHPPTSKEEVAKALIDLKADAEKLQVDMSTASSTAAR